MNEQQPKLSNKVINRIKKFDEKFLKLNKFQKLLIDELILNKELNFRYKRYGLCKECLQPRTGHSWCHQCNSKNFQRNFKNWTSKNCNVDSFIRRAQLKAKKYFEVLEWVEFDRFEDVEYLARGGFGTVYKATWKDGYIKNWDSENNQWVRYRHKNYPVALKCLDNSQGITIEFLKEVESHLIMNTVSYVVCCFGITKDPVTNNFMMIMKYAECGGLRKHLDENFVSMDWDMKLRMLQTIAIGLHNIHDNKLIHHDFHSGNIVILSKDVAMITDLGLCQPANIKSRENIPIYGVLPYLAPEVIRRKGYTQASDIYGFGIIAYEICTGFPPYYNVPHEEFLAIGVCQGLRPKCKYKVPQIILDIIQKCWDEDPLKRPKAEKLDKLFRELVRLENSKINKQFIEADEFNERLLSCSTSPSSTGILSYVTHSQAIYTSRLLKFKNIPEIKVADYDKDDDLESVRIGISKLRINK